MLRVGTAETQLVAGRVAVLLTLLLPTVRSHGNSLWPPPWWDAGGKSWLEFGQACAPSSFPRTPYCMWFTNNTVIPDGVEPTIKTSDLALRTYALEAWLS